MQSLKITIPSDLDFSALQLARDASGTVSFDWTPIERICAASGIDLAVFSDSAEDNVAGLVVAWYAEHRQRGGTPDAVAEDLISDMQVDYERCGGISHQPGRS